VRSDIEDSDGVIVTSPVKSLSCPFMWRVGDGDSTPNFINEVPLASFWVSGVAAAGFIKVVRTLKAKTVTAIIRRGNCSTVFGQISIK
jgi:hypothetical protein